MRESGSCGSRPMLALTPEQPSDDAMRRILGCLLTALRAKVDGVLEDSDVVFLHDLRVATRRTRSALGQLEGVLPAKAVAPFSVDFKWLAELTGPCRDLDVWLLDLSLYRGALPHDEGAALSRFESRVQAARDRAHAEVVLGLTSSRFRQLLERWDAFLSMQPATADPPRDAETPVKALADRRIARAYTRVLRRSRDLGDDPAAEALHRLRIAAKKLRYLLEFFRSLYPAERVDPHITELKGLQDVLGELNDRGIQRARLAIMAHELEDTVGADTLAAMSDLGSVLDRRHEELRAVFGNRLDPIVSTVAQREYRALFGV
ncbi:MAG: CHAD domain-containing protein [Thermoanaerobaculales bacterium]